MRIDEIKPFGKKIPDNWSDEHGAYKSYEKYVDKIMSFIDSHCDESIIDMKKAKTFLYRRINYDSGVSKVFLSMTPTHRESVSGFYSIILLDKILKQAGFTSLRSNSIAHQTIMINMGLVNYFIFSLLMVFLLLGAQKLMIWVPVK
jgi:hypothetical protein